MAKGAICGLEITIGQGVVVMRKEKSLDRLMEAVRAAGFSMAGEPTETALEPAGQAKSTQGTERVMPGPSASVELASTARGDDRSGQDVRSRLRVYIPIGPAPASLPPASIPMGAGLPATIMATGWLHGWFPGLSRQTARG